MVATMLFCLHASNSLQTAVPLVVYVYFLTYKDNNFKDSLFKEKLQTVKTKTLN